MSRKDRPKTIVVVRRKKGAGGGHHGGAWKVAYADFVTAMMAFFMVMWIIGMDDSAKQAIEGYFSNPVGYKKGYSSGSTPLSSGNSPSQVHSAPVRLIMRAQEHERLEEAGARIRELVAGAAALRGLAAHVEIVITEQGLRIELVEGRDGQTFFALGSAGVKPAGAIVLDLIAVELSQLINPLVVEGHTDSARFGSEGYTNWELSADRANAARRILERHGVNPARIQEVRGHADRHLRVPERPLDPTNRRITILLPFTTPPVGEELHPGGAIS